MVKVGKVYAPVSARIIKGGQYTQFSISQRHKGADRKYIKDGFINVLVNGEYVFNKGDTIKILKQTAANLISWNGKQYFSIYAEIEYITAEQRDFDDTFQGMDEDIPEELL